MNPISCIIIDDEELARKLLETYVDKIEYLQCKASFEDPMMALSYLKEHTVDLLFLDIQMPQLKGTEFADLISKMKVRIVFTTAYSEYALQGFELNAMDYLVKPITFKRFLNAVEKFPQSGTRTDDALIIKSGYDLHKVVVNDIIYIQSDSEYVRYFLENGKKIMEHQSLSKLATTLPGHFLRVHRSFIVNTKKVTGLKGRDLILSEHKIAVSDTYFDKVKKALF